MVLDAVPVGAARVLEVGCGEGLLARELAGRVERVTAIDVDESILAFAQATNPMPNIDYLRGDFLTYPFDTTFDAAVGVAVLHHVGTAITIERLKELLRPVWTKPPR